ncbi:MAG: hypothetical protein CMJ49_08650 [Planctomycetaceae bacterium]|nr:hypothetical protein [Planctomycetaceae bacterium]
MMMLDPIQYCAPRPRVNIPRRSPRTLSFVPRHPHLYINRSTPRSGAVPIKRILDQWFSIAIAALFVLAWLFPATPDFLNPHDITKYAAVVIVFLATGLSLKSEETLHGLTAWPIHLFIQTFSFILLPLLTWLAVRYFGSGLPQGLQIGFYLLAAVPTTISSCVVFTHLAGGRYAVSLFNAVLGNFAGIIITPLLLIAMMGAADTHVDIDALAVFRKLALIVLLPFAVGQLLHHLVGPRVAALRTTYSVVNRVCILTIVYVAFGGVFERDWTAANIQHVIWPLVLLIPAHFIALALSDLGARLCRFAHPDRIAVLFTAPQKTLALGLPMISTILADKPKLLGVAVLPLIIYHMTQLFVAGFLVEPIKRRST